MAYTDDTTGGRVIEQGVGPVKVTLAGTVEVGDLLCYNSGWVVADSDATATSDVALVAGEAGVSTKVITAYQEARVSGYTSGTAGNLLYLSATAGGSAAAAGTYPTVVGFELGGGEVYLKPRMGMGGAGSIIPEDVPLYIGDVGVSIQSTGDGMLKISADHTTSAAAINMADAVTFSDNITMASGKVIYLKGTGAKLASTAAGKVTIAATGAGNDDISMNGTVTLTDNVTLATGKSLRGGSSTGAGFTVKVACSTADQTVINCVGATGTSPKLGLFGATPVTRPAHIPNATVATVTKFNLLLTRLRGLGILATA